MGNKTGRILETLIETLSKTQSEPANVVYTADNLVREISKFYADRPRDAHESIIDYSVRGLIRSRDHFARVGGGGEVVEKVRDKLDRV